MNNKRKHGKPVPKHLAPHLNALGLTRLDFDIHLAAKVWYWDDSKAKKGKSGKAKSGKSKSSLLAKLTDAQRAELERLLGGGF